MQAALKDLSLSRHDSEPFLICQRLLNQCHEIIFGDIVLSNAPYGALNQLIIPGTLRKKVNYSLAYDPKDSMDHDLGELILQSLHVLRVLVASNYR